MVIMTVTMTDGSIYEMEFKEHKWTIVQKAQADGKDIPELERISIVTCVISLGGAINIMGDLGWKLISPRDVLIEAVD